MFVQEYGRKIHSLQCNVRPHRDHRGGYFGEWDTSVRQRVLHVYEGAKHGIAVTRRKHGLRNPKERGVQVLRSSVGAHFANAPISHCESVSRLSSFPELICKTRTEKGFSEWQSV